MQNDTGPIVLRLSLSVFLCLSATNFNLHSVQCTVFRHAMHVSQIEHLQMLSTLTIFWPCSFGFSCSHPLVAMDTIKVEACKVQKCFVFKFLLTISCSYDL